MDLVIPDVLLETCATRQALERLASKWRVLVIYGLLAGPQRHSQLRPPVARNQPEGPHRDPPRYGG